MTRDAGPTKTLHLLPRDTCARPTIAWHDARGAHTVIIDRPMLVGSAARADVVIADEAVSHLHAELDPRADGLWVNDLGSRNGTFVEDVLVTVARVPERARIRVGETTVTLRAERAQAPLDLWPEDRLGDLVGASAPMRQLYATIVRIAASEAPVLVSGETGSGKELVARAIHDCSNRADSPFVVIDCAALPENLLESELFGHAKGAFTGASSARIGAFEAADSGTVFLDEIGELPLAMQPKLLRVLESRTVRKVGESSHRKVDVRVVSATHRDLRGMVNDGNFREDLYFRIAVLPVRVPPLRERMEDLPQLVERFAPKMPAAERAALATELAGRRLAGNVRELRNIVERAALLGTRAAMGITEGDEPSLPQGVSELDLTFHDFQRATERRYLHALLEHHGGNVTSAAERAGVNRTYLYRLLKKHSL